MFRTDSVYSLTDFQRNTKSHILRLKETQLPEILTVQGHAEVVVQDAAAYQAMADKLEAVEAVRNALKSVRNGEVCAMEQVFDDLRNELNIE